MEWIMEVFPGILYILASILLVVIIIFVIRLIETLGKVNETIEDIQGKSEKLNGVFDIVDRSADAINMISDTAVSFVTTKLMGFMNKKKDKSEGDE